MCAIMDSVVNAAALQPEEFLLGPPGFRSGGIAEGVCHPILTLEAHLNFAKAHSVNVIPELKDTASPGLTQFLSGIGRDYRWLADTFAHAVASHGFTGRVGATGTRLSL